MTIDEHDDPTVKLIRERGATKRRRAMLQSELQEAGRSLHDIGGALKHTSLGRIGNGIDYLLPKLSSVPAICDLGRIRMMLEELKEVETKLAQLNRIASEMGID